MENPELIGIFGGTFDPVHWAHLAVADSARNHLGIKRILWIPVGQPAHKPTTLTNASHRIAMLRAAIAEDSESELDLSETENLQPSFTIHTLLRLRRRFGFARPLVLLMGADAFLSVTGWLRWREVFSYAHIGIAARSGFPLGKLVGNTPSLQQEFSSRQVNAGHLPLVPGGFISCFPLMANPKVATLSASKIRSCVAAEEYQTLRSLLPQAVLEYIHSHKLYSS